MPVGRETSGELLGKYYVLVVRHKIDATKLLNRIDLVIIREHIKYQQQEKQTKKWF
jgi:hypothetical protein